MKLETNLVQFKLCILTLYLFHMNIFFFFYILLTIFIELSFLYIFSKDMLIEFLKDQVMQILIDFNTLACKHFFFYSPPCSENSKQFSFLLLLQPSSIGDVIMTNIWQSIADLDVSLCITHTFGCIYLRNFNRGIFLQKLSNNILNELKQFPKPVKRSCHI